MFNLQVQKKLLKAIKGTAYRDTDDTAVMGRFQSKSFPVFMISEIIFHYIITIVNASDYENNQCEMGNKVLGQDIIIALTNTPMLK